MEKELNDFIASGFVGGIIVLFFKMLWDYFRTGRMEKGVYMLIAECEKRQLACGMSTFKRELQDISEQQVKTDTRLKEIEKQLDQGRNNFILVMDDISHIKQTLASMPTASSFNSVKTDIGKIQESVAKVQTIIEYTIKHTENHD